MPNSSRNFVQDQLRGEKACESVTLEQSCSSPAGQEWLPIALEPDGTEAETGASSPGYLSLPRVTMVRQGNHDIGSPQSSGKHTGSHSTVPATD